jgi:hypothetical protein
LELVALVVGGHGGPNAAAASQVIVQANVAAAVGRLNDDLTAARHKLVEKDQEVCRRERSVRVSVGAHQFQAVHRSACCAAASCESACP